MRLAIYKKSKQCFLLLLYTIFSFSWMPLYGSMEDHFTPCLDKPLYPGHQIDGIDYIYMINLDKRPERLQKSFKELEPYGIIPYRFSAVDGSKLIPEVLYDLSVIYQKDMESNHWAHVIESDGKLGYVFLKQDTPQLPILSEWMTLGAVGCALSHLSVLQDAYDSGYNTIWVLEDDIKVKENPLMITELMKTLDEETHGDWDILYTDPTGLEIKAIDLDQLWWMWRPDQKLYNTKTFSHREELTKNFIAVGSHTRTHSMIIRRSGMEKILNHLKEHRLYLPIDHELAFPPDINLYVTSQVLVTYSDSVSDIKPQAPSPLNFGQSDWESYKKQQLTKLNEFAGWCDQEKANHLMDFIHEHKPQMCVEIGSFGGSTTFPMITALRYLMKGQLFAIDAWDNQKAIAGLEYTDPNYAWWKKLDLEQIYQKFISLLGKMRLTEWCKVIKKPSHEAASQFSDESIDLIYIDGNFSSSGSLDDVITYFPKVKPGGYIWINNASLLDKLPSITYLMEHAIWLKEDSLENRCVVFQKETNPSNSTIKR